MSRRRERLLLARRQELMVESAILREHLANHAQGLKRPLRIADSVVEACRWVRLNPLWPAVAVGLFVVLRPRLVVGWGLRALGAWRLWKRIRPFSGPVLRGLLGR